MDNTLTVSEMQSSSEPNSDLLFEKLAIPVGANRWPARITTNWRRFSSGLWRIPEGDISAAYCGDTFPRLKAFFEGGQLFTTCSSHGRSLRMQADCYPLLPFDETLRKNVRYTYEGRVGSYHGNQVILGPKVIFEASEPSPEEWRLHLQAVYADGGWFARQQTYQDFLSAISPGETENERLAIALEMKSERAPFSKTEIQNALERSTLPRSGTNVSQMALF